MKHAFLLSIFILTIYSCQPVKPEFGIAEKYFPSAQKLQDGVVNKYYEHYNSNDNYEASTNVVYHEYRLVRPGVLQLNHYNAGFEMRRQKTYTFQNEKMILNTENFIYYADTVPVEIIEPTSENWSENEAIFEKKMEYISWKRKWSHRQIGLRDSVIMGKSAKLITSKNVNYFLISSSPDTTFVNFNHTNVYVEDIGLFAYYNADEKGKTRLELIEQMPFSEFKKRANHGKKRVAYINPKNRMDKDSDFAPCHVEHRIVDYYNGSPDAHFVGEKGALWQEILPNLDKTKLHNESGYLTFRFIINCEGKTGYFVTEQADLDYHKKEFHPETVQYFYKMVSELSPFQPAVAMKEKRDAYAYLTFKLKDGKLIELLP